MFSICDMPLLRSLFVNDDNQAINILAPTELHELQRLFKQLLRFLVREEEDSSGVVC